MIRRMVQGEPLTIRAADWNQMAALVNRLDGTGSGTSQAGFSQSQRQLMVQNLTGSHLATFSVVALRQPFQVPVSKANGDDDSAENIAFRYDPTFCIGAEKPQFPDDCCNWAVMCDECAIGSFATALVGGVTQCRLNVVHASDEWANITDNELGHLTTSAIGPARILWKESGTGLKWGVILFHRSAPKILGKTASGISSGAAGTVNVWAGTQGSESATGQTVTAYNRFADIDSGKWVHVVWVGNGLEITLAEC